ncbi:MAG: glycoside hydrolase family 5 protein [Oscillospiraceae bacterium]|nr:glycoside hydrolase family 5 protein [Oscillospiraceae bacterium]
MFSLKKAAAAFLAVSMSFTAMPAVSALSFDKAPVNESITAKQTDAQKFVSKIKVGWNLGNALDATGGSGLNTETSWGNPKTTQKMIKDIKAAGFNAVRLPTTWYKHVNDKGSVSVAWMKRVKEVVDYAYKNDMYVILNSHHDNSYYKVGVAGDSAQEKIYINKMRKLWNRIAVTFKDYDEHLIFETLNEPREEGSKMEWQGGTSVQRDYIFKLNKAIVKTIRNAGGKNKKRYIMCPTNAATSNTSILRNADFPDDARVIISVHYYKWDDFNDYLGGKFVEDEKKGIDNFFSELNDIFISKGRAVIIGECGSTNRNNESVRAEWGSYFVKAAKKYGIAVFFWDNNADGIGGENYMLYNRKTGEFPHKSIIDAIVKAASGK